MIGVESGLQTPHPRLGCGAALAVLHRVGLYSEIQKALSEFEKV